MINACTWKIFASVWNYLDAKAPTQKEKVESEADFISSAVHRKSYTHTWVELISFSLKKLLMIRLDEMRGCVNCVQMYVHIHITAGIVSLQLDNCSTVRKEIKGIHRSGTDFEAQERITLMKYTHFKGSIT